MCDTWTPAGEPLPTNTRAVAEAAFNGHEDEEPWFGLEQEFTLFELDEKTPLGWPKGGAYDSVTENSNQCWVCLTSWPQMCVCCGSD